MASAKKDNLYELVNSLSKSEKRQFNLYIGRFDANHQSNFMALFNVLGKTSEYNEDFILKKTSIKKQQLSNTKAHLYKQILISLRLNPLHQNTYTYIREQLDFATILYSKGMYKQSLKILDKAKQYALENYISHLAYEIVELEKSIESQYITRSMNDRADVLAVQAKELSLRNVLISKLSNLSLQLYSQLLRIGYARSEEDIVLLKQYFDARMPKIDIHKLGVMEKLYLYKAKLWYSFVTQDFLSSYKNSRRWILLFETNLKLKQLHPVFYIKGFNYLLESTFMVQKPDKFRKYLEEFKENIDDKSFLFNENTDCLSFLYYNLHKINLFFIEGEFTEGTLFIPELLEGLKKYEGKIDAHHTMVFNYKIGCLYFGIGDYENSIIFLNKIIEDKTLKMREDLLCFSRILNLVAHYEAGKDGDIDRLIKSTYKFLLKMDDMHEVQRLMMDFLKRLVYLYPHELKGAFQDLYNNLKRYENHPYEKRAFLYLDILSWLKSNMEGVPVEQIIKNKIKIGIDF